MQHISLLCAYITKHACSPISLHNFGQISSQSQVSCHCRGAWDARLQYQVKLFFMAHTTSILPYSSIMDSSIFTCSALLLFLSFSSSIPFNILWCNWSEYFHIYQYFSLKLQAWHHRMCSMGSYLDTGSHQDIGGGMCLCGILSLTERNPQRVNLRRVKWESSLNGDSPLSFMLLVRGGGERTMNITRITKTTGETDRRTCCRTTETVKVCRA